MKNEIITPLLAKEKIIKYCDYQERCKKEVIAKLKSWNIDDETIDDIIIFLIEQNFINEQRFTDAYSIGKLRQLGWGKLKIKSMLLQKGISEKCIKNSFKNIDEDEYLSIATKEMRKKMKLLKQNDTFTLKFRLISFLQNKGFEYETAEKTYNDIFAK